MLLAWVAGLAACSGSERREAPVSEGERVTIARDAMGVAHVTGESAEGTMFGAGYAAAEDRLFQIEFLRRRANGSLAELLGPSAVGLDRDARTKGYTDVELQQMFEALPESHQRLFLASRRGINAYIEKAQQDPGRYLPIEYQRNGVALTPLSLPDALRIVVLTVREYGGAGGRELNNLAFLTEMTQRYGASKAQQILDDIVVLNDPDADTIVRRGVASKSTAAVEPPASRALSTTMSSVAASVTDAQIARAELLESLGFAQGASRSLIIGPKRSADGKVMMLQSTADGFDIHLSGGGFETAGLVIGFGAPVMGRGVQHGWLITTGESDTSDVMEHELNPSNPKQYRYQGNWRDFDVREEIINVRGAEPIVHEVKRSVHGPIIAADAERKRAYALKSATEYQELEGWRAVLDFGRARSLAEFRAALPDVPQNITVSYGGEDGHIEVWHAGRQPIRASNIDPRLPTPGDGSADWQGFVPFEQWVNEANPAEGYFFAWNNKPSPETTYGDESRYGKHFRAWLGHKLVASRPKITYQDMKDFNRALAHGSGGIDLAATNPAFFKKVLRDAVARETNPRRKEAVERMLSWNGLREDSDSDDLYDNVGQTLFETWRVVALQTVFNDDIGTWAEKLDAAAYIKYRTSLLLRALQGAEAGKPMVVDYLNGKPVSDVIRRSLDDTLRSLETRFATSDMSTWQEPIAWRTFDVKGLVGSAAVALGKIPARVRQNGNDSWNALMQIDATKPPIETLIPTGGQSRFISLDGVASRHIADQVERHRALDFKSIAISEADVRAATRGTPTVLRYRP
jgi:acyl-homoserine lactone acylase PvdQ